MCSCSTFWTEEGLVVRVVGMGDCRRVDGATTSCVVEGMHRRPRTALKLTAKDAPIKACGELVRSRRNGGAACGGIAAFGLSRCVNLSKRGPRDCHCFVSSMLFGRLSVRGRGAFIPGNATRSLKRRYHGCRDGLGGRNNVSLRVLKVNGGKRVNFGRPKASFSSGARVISLTSSAVGTGTEFFRAVRRIPARTVAVKVSAVVRDERVLLLTSNRTGTSTVRGLLKGKIGRRFPTSVLGGRPGIGIVTSRTTLDTSGISMWVK